MGGREFYERFYTGASQILQDWRRLGAIDKSQSVLQLTAGLDISRVIDVGAGTGALLELLIPARPNWSFVAVEIAGSAVDLITRLQLPRLEACLFDGIHLSYGDEAFDLAILSHVIEHLEEPSALIQEAARVARWVCIEVPVEGTPALNAIWWVRQMFGKRRASNDVGHIRFFSRFDWNRMFELNGLTITQSRQYTVTKEVLTFGLGGRGLFKARLKLLGQRLFGRRLWADLYQSNYAVLCVAPRNCR